MTVSDLNDSWRPSMMVGDLNDSWRPSMMVGDLVRQLAT